MIKIVFCLRRKPGLSPDEFDRTWREDHAPLVKQHAETLGIRRYVQTIHTAHEFGAGAAKAQRHREARCVERFCINGSVREL